MQPGGVYEQRQGEYYAATPHGGAGRSCKTSLRPDKMFVGQDFADSAITWSGPIDIACAALGIPKYEPQKAVKMAAERLGFHPPENPKRPPEIVFRALTPPDNSQPDFSLGDREPSLVSAYKKLDGSLFCVVARYEGRHKSKRKLVLPWAYGELDGVTDWHRRMPSGPRPLFGLDELILHAGKRPVLIVEGEKTREAAKRLIGDRFFVTTWIGGCQAIGKTNFRILDGSVVYIWPDADEAGRKAALKIADTLKAYPPAKVFIVTPPKDVKPGWDLADAELEGWRLEGVERHIETHSIPYEKGNLDSVTVKDEAAALVFGPPVPFDVQSPPSIPSNILPGILGIYSSAAANAIQAPFELALINALGATAAAAQRKFRVVIHEGYSEPLNIHSLVVLFSGERKTANLEACRFALVEWEEEQQRLIEPELKQALAERQIHEETRKTLLASAKKCKTSEERKTLARELADLQNEAGDLPMAPRLLADDVTPEALAVLMSKHNQRIAILEAEGGFFDILSGRYTGGMPNLDLVLKAWSGEAVRVDRRHAEPVILNEPTLTMILNAQPEVLSGLARTQSFRGRGLLGRLLFLLPKSLVGSREVDTKPIPSDVREAYRQTLWRLLNLPCNDGQRPHYLQLDSEAHRLWLGFAQDVEGQLSEGGALHTMRDWGGKLPGQILRLAGLAHVTLHQYPHEVMIGADLMTAVIRLSEYLVEHAKAAFNLLGTDETIECAKAILKWLATERLENFSARSCLEKVKGRWPKMEQINAGLNILEDRGYILPEVKDTPARGRPSRTYLVNPCLSERAPC